jgi:SNF2 family DNA or RNA helicase
VGHPLYSDKPSALENELKIIDNKALLLTLRNPHRITTVIPKSRELPNNQVLVHWGLDEAQVLRNLHVKNVPSPIMGRYDWPGQYKPFDHQKTTSAFLTMNRRAFCLNEQGTGKTGSAIWAADYLIKQKRIRRVLVICPLSIMDSAWRADLFKFAMHRSVDIAYGAKDKRKAIINGNSEFIIINYDGVEIVAEDIAKGGFDLIVVDEANAYKNVQTKRWKVLNSLVKHDTWLWMMTGTPAAQSPLDAYGLAKLVNPNGVPKYYTSYRDQVMIKLTNFKWIAKETATQTVYAALQPAIRYTKDECLDLPEMTYTKRQVELTKQQERYYNMLKSRMVIQAAGEEITSVNAAVNMSKLLQISCGAVYSDSGETLEFDIKNRYNVLTEVIDESSQKVLVFVPFKHVIRILTDKLNADGYTTEVIVFKLTLKVQKCWSSNHKPPRTG